MAAKEFGVKLVIRRLQGWKTRDGEGSDVEGDVEGFSVEFRWGDEEDSAGRKKGAKLRTSERAALNDEGRVLREEEFRSECWLADWGCGAADEQGEIEFKVLAYKVKRVTKRSVTLGTGSIRLSQWISKKERKEYELILPVLQSRNGCGTNLLLTVTLSLLDLGGRQLSYDSAQKPSVPGSSSPWFKNTTTASNGPSKTKIDIVYTRKKWKSSGLRKKVLWDLLETKMKRCQYTPEFEHSLLQICRKVALPVRKRKCGVRVAKRRKEVINLEDSEDDCQILDNYIPPQATGYTSRHLLKLLKMDNGVR